jgi:hypothetical protein
MNLNIAPSAQDVYFDVQVNPQRVELNPPEVKLGASAAPPHDCQDFLHWLLRGSRPSPTSSNPEDVAGILE